MKASSKKSALVGVVMILTAIWGGAWLMTVFPIGSPFDFAAVVSAMMLGIGGFLVLMKSLVNIDHL